MSNIKPKKIKKEKKIIVLMEIFLLHEEFHCLLRAAASFLKIHLLFCGKQSALQNAEQEVSNNNKKILCALSRFRVYQNNAHSLFQRCSNFFAGTLTDGPFTKVTGRNLV